MDLSTILFCLLGGTALGCSVGLLIARHPLHGALYLIGVMLALAGLYVLLDSPFLGVLQVLVYAGAVMMLMVFVIMVLGRAKGSPRPLMDWLALGGAVVPLLLGAILIWQVGTPGVLKIQADQQLAVRSASTAAMPQVQLTDTPALRGEVQPLARTMFAVEANRGYWLLFQLIGVLLLIAIVGAVLLAKRRLDTPDPDVEADEEAAHDHH